MFAFTKKIGSLNKKNFTCCCFRRHFRKNTSKTNISILPKNQVEVSVQTERIGFRCLVKPFFFTVCFSGGCFTCATVWQYEDMKKKARSWMQNPLWFNSAYKPAYKRGKIRRELNAWWNRRTDAEKIAFSIISINFAVFLMWRVPLLQPFMQRYFCCSPVASPRCLPMFTSVFSHYSFFHLAANMFVLQSFCTSSVAFFGKEQFLALYCSGGVISSFASYINKVACSRFTPSLGASGALMAILSSTCVQFPNSQLAFILLPFITISAGNAIKLIMAIDFVGMCARWRLLDHAAHLGGSCFGVLYLWYGSHYIWGNREYLIYIWRKLTEKSAD